MPLRLIGVVLILAASLCAQPPKPQSVFTSDSTLYKYEATGQITIKAAEPTVAHPIPIPPRVLELIRQDPLFLTMIEHLDDKGFVDPQNAKPVDQQDWLVASDIDLGCTRGVLVAGQGLLRGQRRMTPFWIFAADQAGEYQPPFAVVADRIRIKGRGKSCRELRVSVGHLDFKVRTTSFRLRSDNGTLAFVRQRSWEETPPWIRPSADAIRKPPPDIGCPRGSSGHYPECTAIPLTPR